MIDVQNPPKEIRLVLIRENDIVQPGEWFLPPMKGTIYLWDFKGPSKERHPVYKLVEE